MSHNRHDIEKRLEHVKPSVRGLRPEEQAELFNVRAAAARERTQPDAAHRYGDIARHAGSIARSDEVHTIAVAQANDMEVIVPVTQVPKSQ